MKTLLFIIFLILSIAAIPTTQPDQNDTDDQLEPPVVPVKTVEPSTQPIAQRANMVVGNEINEAQKESVRKGLEWLAGQQAEDGSYAGGGYGNSNGGNCAITSFAAIAFMESGSLPNRGRYGENVQKCLEFILDHVRADGLINNGESQPMYCHIFSVLFLAEAYGMTSDERVKESLNKAVHLIENSQNPEGGFRYEPFLRNDADLSVTVGVLAALRSSRDSGISVDKEVINKTIKYIMGCQNSDGGYVYQTNQIGSNSGFARTGGAVSALYYSGVFEGKGIEKGLAYLTQYLPGKTSANEGMYYYGQYYVGQSFFLAGGEYWKSYYPAIRDEIISKQEPGGNFTGSEAGDAYGCAMALIILQFPNKYLPAYNGKGPGD